MDEIKSIDQKQLKKPIHDDKAYPLWDDKKMDHFLTFVRHIKIGK